MIRVIRRGVCVVLCYKRGWGGGWWCEASGWGRKDEVKGVGRDVKIP